MTTDEAIRILISLQEPEPWEPQITEKAYDALEMAIEALNNSEIPNSSDTVYRQAVIDALGEEPPVWYDGEDELAERDQWRRDVNAIKALPPAEPEKRTENTQKTHACDSISRQAALAEIDRWVQAFKENRHMQSASDARFIISGIAELPPAEPDNSKYEYHYDHTDCIWYRPEARNRCPVTCAQYRDGWNDAMNYIYKGGKGYRPYRRGEKYE